MKRYWSAQMGRMVTVPDDEAPLDFMAMTAEEIHDTLASDQAKEELAEGGWWHHTLNQLVRQARIFKPDLWPDEANHIWFTMRDYLWPREGEEE